MITGNTGIIIVSVLVPLVVVVVIVIIIIVGVFVWLKMNNRPVTPDKEIEVCKTVVM